MKTVVKSFARIADLVGRFWTDRRGVAAVEFVFVAPICIVMLGGLFEGSNLFEAARKTNAAAHTIGDLVARTRSIDVSGLEDVFAVTNAIMMPFDTEAVTYSVTAVSIDENGKGTVVWSRRKDGPGLAKNSPYAVSPDLVAGGNNFLVFVDVTFDYVSPLTAALIVKEIDIDRTFVMVPRVSTTIPCSDC
ncbi:MAG: pilus assembly protein [Fulvimarina manganoxydans]|uniref:TadE/TadG family type IV pilus assembly protein n=1 Tax=Fulvimarina manganoxydans TaxID=937218 RepID=UPI002356CF4D|nr:TadE/TadG family type IV pilus assembly protein [Fulvimarina manganoxydans]MCK5933524.1 pilus assembly protein [Fulvimarina manganoxydans]